MGVVLSLSDDRRLILFALWALYLDAILNIMFILSNIPFRAPAKHSKCL